MEQAGRIRARQLRDEDELSFREIAAVLEAEEIRPKRGERWHPQTVRRMLANASDAAEAAFPGLNFGRPRGQECGRQCSCPHSLING
ncbi:recombinase family protein [Streptomyces sp. NPDC002917]|uniref:recombinase family protein n=1 Tax=Streptomyces sp. NPDC002917 TaxID=3364671 RepID=UPI003683F0E6